MDLIIANPGGEKNADEGLENLNIVLVLPLACGKANAIGLQKIRGLNLCTPQRVWGRKPSTCMEKLLPFFGGKLPSG